LPVAFLDDVVAVFEAAFEAVEEAVFEAAVVVVRVAADEAVAAL